MDIELKKQKFAGLYKYKKRYHHNHSLHNFAHLLELFIHSNMYSM